jgi:hypothetical protein
MFDAFETVSAFGNPDFHRRRHFLMIGFNDSVLFLLLGTQSGPVRIAPKVGFLAKL